MRRLKQQFGDDLVIIGVHSAKFPTEKETENIHKAVQRLGIHHPVVNDAGFKIWNSYAVRAWPTLVLIDPRGRIVSDLPGEIQAENVAQHIQAVLEEHTEEHKTGALNLTPPPQIRDPFDLYFPSKLLTTSSGKIWISDSGNHRILECTWDQNNKSAQVNRVFGNGRPGWVDGKTKNAQFNHPHGLTLQGDPENGVLFVADTENHVIRQINLKDEIVTTIAGTGKKAHGRFPLGLATQTDLRSPWALTLLDNFLFIAMAGSHQIWIYDLKDHQLGIFAGNGYEALIDGSIKDSSFNQPSDITSGLNHLFVADPEASAIRAISLTEDAKTITLVGQGLFDFGDVDGAQSQALLQHPTGLVFKDNLLYIADTYNHKIKVLDPQSGIVTTLAGTGQSGVVDGHFSEASFYEPEGINGWEHYLLVADTNNHQIRVLNLNTDQAHTLTLDWQTRNTIQGATIHVPIGEISLVMKIVLPDEYKITPQSTLQINLNGKDFTFQSDQELIVPLLVTDQTSLSIQLYLQYCQQTNTQLCYQQTLNYLVPLNIDPALSLDEPIILSLPIPV